ncbi:MAG: GUN4 domain-containing protein, partial [Cyanobacteria bacterium J06635_10]
MQLDELFEDGEQRYKFCQALEDAFLDIGTLERVVNFGLNLNLNAINHPNNLKQAVFELVMWAKSYGKLQELINAVCHCEYGNPGNPKLKPFCQQYSQPQPVKEAVQEQPQPTATTLLQIPEDDLPSERGIDYTRLRDLLKAGNWKEADQKTAIVMLKAAGREKQDYLYSSDIEKFPCTDLRTID